MERRTKLLLGVLCVLLVCGVGLLVYLVLQPGEFRCVFCGERMEVRAYFLNDSLDPEVTCTKVFPVSRDVPRTDGVARTALGVLFRGPTEEERARGYSSAIPIGVSVRTLSIQDGVAYVDLSAELDRGVGGSCRVTAIRSQIVETLKQFPTVQDVVISIDGNSADILQP